MIGAEIVIVQSQYGSSPEQVLTMTRDKSLTGPRPTVLMFHGGGWRSGSRASLQPTAEAWAARGWVAVTADYRTGQLDGVREDGRKMMADATTVLDRFLVKPYVDPGRVMVYGASAGGHIAAWLAAYRGADVAGAVLLSPTSNIPGAVAEGRLAAPGTPAYNLGRSAEEFWTWPSRAGEPVTWLSRVRAGERFRIVVSAAEWVDPAVHGGLLATQLGSRARLTTAPGFDHAGAIVASRPELATELIDWADGVVR